jgi:hypothetical protein
MKKWTDPISGRTMAQGTNWQAVAYANKTHAQLTLADGRTVQFIEFCTLDQFIERMGDN